MLYYLFKPLVQLWFKIFYRKIYFTNAHTLPNDRPLIFAVNHPTAFLDPMIIAVFLSRTLHFLLRGDVFRSGAVEWALNSLKTIPIFRARDGFQNLKNNQATFDRCYKMLADGKHVLVLAEGVSKHEKRMRPIQKGTARMAFGSFEKYKRKDIVIIPVGVNFTNPHRFRSEVMVDIGPAIPLEDYMADYESNPRRGVTQLTKEISKRMKKRIVHVDNPEDDDFVEQLLALNRNFKQESILPAIARGHTWLWEEKHIADTVNEMPEAEKQQLREEVNDYYKTLKKHNISDVSVAKPGYFSWVNSIILAIGFLPFVVGFVVNAWPLVFGKWLADKVVKKIEFHASVRFAVGMFSYALFFLLMLVFALVLGNVWFVLFVLAMPVLGYFALHYRDLYQYWRGGRRFNGLDKSVKTLLRKKREQLSSSIDIPAQVAERA